MTTDTNDNATDTTTDVWADMHRAELAAAPNAIVKVRYARQVLGPDATRPQVKQWLIEQGHEVQRATFYEAWKKAEAAPMPDMPRSVTDTADLPKLTDEQMAALDAATIALAAPATATESDPEPEPEDDEAAADIDPEPSGAEVRDVPDAEDRTPVVEPEPIPAGTPGEIPGESGIPAGPDIGAGVTGFRPDTAPDATGVRPDSAGIAPESAGVQPDMTEMQRRMIAGVPRPIWPKSAYSTPDPAPAPAFAEQSGRTPDKAELPWWMTGMLYVAALATLPMSLNTSWRFFEKVLHIDSRVELLGMAAIMELALLVCGVGMAVSVRRFGDPGPFRLVVWGICGFSAWTAWFMSDGIGESFGRLILGPVTGAVMLHLALGLIKRTHHQRTGPLARVARELRERLLSRLGLADDDRTAAQRTRDRAATRAVALSFPARLRWSRKARLQRALLAAGVADDPIMRDKLLARRAVVAHAGELAGLSQGSPWAE